MPLGEVGNIFAIVSIVPFLDAAKRASTARKTFYRLYSFNDFVINMEAEISRLESKNKSHGKLFGSAPKRLVVRKAKIRTTDQLIELDVTSEVRKKIVNDQIDYVVSDDLVGGDFAPNMKKELWVQYSYNKQELSRLIPVGEKLSIP
jgi:hypothetical protein